MLHHPDKSVHQHTGHSNLRAAPTPTQSDRKETMMIRGTTAATFALAATMIVASAGTLRADEPGERVFKSQCGTCHTVEEGKNRVGPSLAGIVGRKSGQVPGFKYSAANKNADITWTPETLDKYLINPKAMVPGTTMTYIGLKNEKQRADLIAYLATRK